MTNGLELSVGRWILTTWRVSSCPAIVLPKAYFKVQGFVYLSSGNINGQRWKETLWWDLLDIFYYSVFKSGPTLKLSKDYSHTTSIEHPFRNQAIQTQHEKKWPSRQRCRRDSDAEIMWQVFQGRNCKVRFNKQLRRGVCERVSHYVQICMLACAQKLEEDTEYPGPSLSTLFPWDRVLHWPWSSAGSQQH